MSFFNALKACRSNIKFGEIINFKKHRLKNIYLFSDRKKHSSNSESVCIFCTNVSHKMSMLSISQYSIQSTRTEYFQSRSQKFVIKSASDSKRKGLSHKSLLNSLQKCETVLDQIEVFNSSMKLPDEELGSRSSICHKLEEILKPYYSSCTVQLVGSSINGLGIKGCDVDLSLHSPHFKDNQDLYHLYHGNAAFHEEILEGKLPENKLYNFSPKVQLLSIRTILQNMKFAESATVIPGRVPILSFYHQSLSCDLAINNNSALGGTNLMLLCSRLDERVPKLVRTIIYWAKHSKLIGGPVRFKSYALFLLVVYFLQTRSPPVLPPLDVIFEKTDFMKNLQNWSYDVGIHLTKFERSKNIQNVEELLREFFFFYGNFDFTYIICPINSSSIDRKKFVSNIDCKNNFELNTICIQDPINFSWNVTTEVAWKHCKNFLKALISVCDRYQDSKLWIPTANNWGLASLIDDVFSYRNLEDIKEFTINIPLTTRGADNFHQNKELMKRVTYSVKQILNYCLLFECHLVDSETNLSLLDIPQNVRAAIESQFFSNDTLQVDHSNFEGSSYSLRYVCVTRDTWSGRNTFSMLKTNPNSLENEHIISKKMDSLRDNSEKELFYFLCECRGVKIENEIYLQMKLKPLNSEKFKPKLAIFLKYYIPTFTDKYLLDCENKKELSL